MARKASMLCLFLLLNVVIGVYGEFKIPPFHRTQLSNGLNIIISKRDITPLIEGQIVIKTGAQADPGGKEGLANLTAIMLLRSAKGRKPGELFTILDDHGASLSAHSDWDTSRFTFSFLKDEFPAIMELLSGLLTNPDFQDKELQQTKGLILSQLRSLPNDNWQNADRWFYRALFREDRYASLPQGEEESIARITLSDIEAFYKSHYKPENILFLLGGDIDEDSLQRIQDQFGLWQGVGSTQDVQTQGRSRAKGRTLWLVDKPDMTQSQIRIGNIGIPWGHPHFYAVQVLNTFFGFSYGSILMDELRRKRGLTYGVASQFEFGRSAGPYFIWTFTSNEKTSQVVRLTLEVMKSVNQGNFSLRDVDSAKKYLLTNFSNRVQAPNQYFQELLRYELTGRPMELIKNYADEIQNVSIEKIREVARTYLDPDNIVIVILGRRSAIEADIKNIKSDLKIVYYTDPLKN
jgi:zinc protease